MNIQMLFMWTMAAGAACLTLAATLLSLHEKGIRPLDELLRLVRWLGWPGQIICGVCALHLIGYGSNKTPTNPPPAGLPPRLMMVQEPTTRFSTGQIAAGAAIVGVGTNEVWGFEPPVGANIVERWRLRGAANERMKLNESMAIDTFGRVWTEERLFSPLGLQVGMVPEARWAEIRRESVAWWTETASNTTVVTWENALLFRETNWPVSVQAEFFDDGRFVYRYDLASLGAAASNIFAQVETATGVESMALGEGVTSVWGFLPDAETAAQVAAGVTNETYEIVAEELEATKLWDGFVFRRAVSTNVLYSRTFAVDRKDGWRSYFLSGRGESWCCNGEDAIHDWSLIGAVIDWSDDSGGAGTITNSPSGDSLYLPLSAEATSVTLTLRQTDVRVASPQPVYLLAYTPRIEFPDSQGILGYDGNEYSVYETGDAISMSVDRSNRPCHAALDVSEATEADYALPSGAGVYPWPGERGAEDVAPYRGGPMMAMSNGGGGRRYLVVIDPWVTYGTAHYGCCHTYPYDWGWLGWSCDCTPECESGVEHSAVDAFIDWYDDESAVGVVEVGGVEVWRDTAYHVVWGCDHSYDEPNGYCPCGCDGDCPYCSCRRTDGPSQGSIRFRVSLGECWNGDVAGFAWFESDGPVTITPRLFKFETNPNANVSVSRTRSSVTVTTYETDGRDLTIAAIPNGVTVAVRHHGATAAYQTWEVSNVSNLASVVRLVKRDGANDVREDWTYACCARSDEGGVMSDEWAWTVTDNLASPQTSGETVVVESGTNWVYAADGRLLRLSVSTNDEEIVIRTISYNDDGLPTCVDDGTNGCVTIAYDAAGHVSSMTGPEGTLAAAWDADGVMTNLDTSAWNGPMPMMGPRLTMAGTDGGMTPLDALLHYLYGNGAPVTLPFSEVDTNGLRPIDFQAVKDFVSSCHEPGSYHIVGTNSVPACGQIRLFLGDVPVSLDGWITYTGHCNWSFTGTMSGEDDTYDFNAANRGMLGESLTAIGRMLFEGHGTNYTVQFAGTAMLSGSGHCGER